MITQAESGLTSDQYEALKSAHDGATWSVTAHKFNLDFSEAGADQGRDNTLPNFDAVACGSYIFRSVTDLVLERFNTASAIWQQVTAYTGLSSASSIDTDGAQLVVDGNDLFIFVAETSGIWMQSTSDSGATFSNWQHVTSDENVNKIAVVNKARVHYTVMDTDKNIYNMRVAKYSGSWAKTSSDIWYTYPFSNFVAAELPDGSDMIVAATQVPGITTVKLVVNVPTTYIKQQGGIIGFKYSNNWWGDHYDIDVVDELTAYRFRDRIKLTQFSDRVALTCYSSDGTQLFPYTLYRIYTTVDGKFWSKGNALPLPESPGSSGVKLCQLGDYCYAVEKSRIYKSLMTLQLGYSPTVCQIEIPHRRISNLSITEGDMLQGSMTLSNEDGWLNTNNIISKQSRTLLYFRMGYWVEGTKLDVQTAVAEIDTYDISQTLPRSMVKLSFRDAMSWMTDINSAERPYYWDSQLLGGDNFVDTTNDKYGGLRHLEPQAGSFTSEGSVLNLTSNNEEGVGFSTFSLYLWNGITQSQFMLATVGNAEYGGLTFRSSDKDNFWTLYYDQTTDKIRLAERSGGVEDIKVQTSILSWASTPTTPRWLQVEFRYAHIIGRYSTDGLTWTDCVDYLMSITQSDITPDLLPLANANKERGYVGFIGKGFSPPEVDTWPDDPPPYEPPDFYPYDPPYFPPYDPSYVPYVPAPYGPNTTPQPGVGSGSFPKKVIMASQFGHVFRATNLNANLGTITWTLIHDFNEEIYHVLRDPFNSKQYYFATASGVYRIPNVFLTTVSATLVANNYTLFADPDIYPNGIYISPNKKGWIGVNGSGGFTYMSGGNMTNGPLIGGAVFATTFNSGLSWTHIDVNAGGGNNGASIHGWVYDVPYGSKGTIYVPFMSSNAFITQTNLYKSEDWGLTWSSVLNNVQTSGGIQNLYSPYRRSSSPYALNKIDIHHELIMIGSDSTDHPGFMRSVDAGLTWEDFYATLSPPFTYPLISQHADRNQIIYSANTRIGKSAITVVHSVGGTNPEYLIYTHNGWVTATTIGSAAFKGSSGLTTWPINDKFIIVSRRHSESVGTDAVITEDVSAEGRMDVTSDWINWFEITPVTPISGVNNIYPVYVDVQ